MKNKGLFLAAFVIDVLQIIGWIVGTIWGCAMLYYIVEDYGGVAGYFNELSHLFKPDGEYWTFYVILVGPILIICLLLPVYSIIALVLNIIKCVISIPFIQGNYMEYDKFNKKTKFLFVTSVITFNYISAIMYGIIRSDMKKERTMNMYQRNYYPPYGIR